MPIKTDLDLPPVQSEKMISFYLALATVCTYLSGLLALFCAATDIFSVATLKIMFLVVGALGYTAVFAKGRIPSDEQLRALKNKK